MAGYLMTGVVATLMCVQARQQWLGTFRHLRRLLCHLRRRRRVAAHLPSLIIGALFGYLMKASGSWLSQKTLSTGGVRRPGLSP